MRCKSLIELSLSFNRLTEIPQTLGSLKTLRILYLNDNQLTHLPLSFESLELEHVSMQNNPWIFPTASTVERGLDAVLVSLHESRRFLCPRCMLEYVIGTSKDWQLSHLILKARAGELNCTECGHQLAVNCRFIATGKAHLDVDSHVAIFPCLDLEDQEDRYPGKIG